MTPTFFVRSFAVSALGNCGPGSYGVSASPDARGCHNAPSAVIDAATDDFHGFHLYDKVH